MAWLRVAAIWALASGDHQEFVHQNDLPAITLTFLGALGTPKIDLNRQKYDEIRSQSSAILRVPESPS